MNSNFTKGWIDTDVRVDTQGKVEIYLDDMIKSMNSTLKSIHGSSFKAIETMSRQEWMERDPAQITLLVNMIRWSANVEDCFVKFGQGGDQNSLKIYKGIWFWIYRLLYFDLFF